MAQQTKPSYFWVAINGASVAAQLTIATAVVPKVTPRPQVLVGFPSRKEAADNQRFLLTAPMRDVRKRIESYNTRKDLLVRKYANAEPPTSGATDWGYGPGTSEEPVLSLEDMEGTTPETRQQFAALWLTDWERLAMDMKHCVRFIMRDELADLMSDGLKALGAKLTESERQEWQRIVDGVKAVAIATGSMLDQMRDFPKTQAALNEQCEAMMVLWERIDRLQP